VNCQLTFAFLLLLNFCHAAVLKKKSRNYIKILFIGDGMLKPHLEKRAKNEGLDNIENFAQHPVNYSRIFFKISFSSTRSAPELRNKKWLNPNLTYGTIIWGRSATAVSLGAALVTKDEKIRKYEHVKTVW